MSTISDLPIADLIEGLTGHLASQPRALIIAPPGAGKSTFLPDRLSQAAWAQDTVMILLQPRRIAVRNVASQLARLSGEPLGQRVGYQMRGDAKHSRATRLLVMTEGVFRRRLLADPELHGICAVLFDEYHERSLDSDLCLALCRDVQASLRPDLRLIVMSATLYATDMTSALPDFPIFQSEGRSYPIETVYQPTAASARLDREVVRAVHKALKAHSGNILCFLPGRRDIRFAQSALVEAFGTRDDIQLCPLFGSQNDGDQQAALAPSHDGQRKIILATDIAETSLTVPGVHVVIDSGLRRAPVFDQRLGLTQLQRQRAGIDRLDQRRGRAGRLAPGLCVRLWAEQEMRALASTSKPDIETQDLTDVVLACFDWGVQNIQDLPWTTAAPKTAIGFAIDRLSALGLLTQEGGITAQGRIAAQLPLPADLAALVMRAYGGACEAEAAHLAALLADAQAVGRGHEDLEARVQTLATRPTSADAVTRRRAKDVLKVIAEKEHAPIAPGAHETVGVLLAQVRPQLIAKARGGGAGAFKLAAGRGAFVDEGSSLASAEYLVVGDAILAGQNVRIGSAWPLSARDVETSLDAWMSHRSRIVTHPKSGRRQVERQRCLGEIVVSRQWEQITPGPELAGMMFDTLKASGLSSLPLPEAFRTLMARAAFAIQHGAPLQDLTQEGLLATADIWLMPQLERVESLSDVSGKALLDAVIQTVPYEAMRALDAIAPTSFAAPAGIKLAIDYDSDVGPSVSGKLQAFFGLKTHPMIAQGQVPLSITLLSPAGRPLQSTQDLPAFWAGSYQDVRRDMRGRYPKHPWPEDPATAVPTLRTKAREAKQ